VKGHIQRLSIPQQASRLAATKACSNQAIMEKEKQNKNLWREEIIPTSVFSEEEQTRRKNPEKENIFCRSKCKSLYQAK